MEGAAAHVFHDAVVSGDVKQVAHKAKGARRCRCDSRVMVEKKMKMKMRDVKKRIRRRRREEEEEERKIERESGKIERTAHSLVVFVLMVVVLERVLSERAICSAR